MSQSLAAATPSMASRRPTHPHPQPPGIPGEPGVIQFIGSGRIDQGPIRPGSPPVLSLADSPLSSGAFRGHYEDLISPAARHEAEEESEESHEGGPGRSVASITLAGSNPEVLRSFDGVTERQVELSRDFDFGGEPPDQGLCVGNGFVLETVNSALRVFSRSGLPLTDPIALSQFYGYPPNIDPETFLYSPYSFDISCYFDRDTQRWFHVALTTDIDPLTAEWTGPNRLDIAVSQGPSPLGMWNYYAIPAQNDGSEGTPDHGCSLGPCFGDYPHIGADRNGFYITTNEFSLFDFTYSGVNLYAISKRQLAHGWTSPTVVHWAQFENPSGGLAFRLWPAASAQGIYESRANGTEYFVSNIECDEDVCSDDRLVVWALTNSRSLDSSYPSPRLTSTMVPVQAYTTAPLSDQPPGSIPLAECLNDTTTVTPYGIGCWTYIFFPENEPAHDEVEAMLDSGTDIYQVYFAAGRLWTAQPTAITIDGEEKAGVAYYILRPSISVRGALSAWVEREGQFGYLNNNLIYPTVAATSSGKGVISFTLVGEEHFASPAYVRLDPWSGVGPIHVVKEGAGPIDGFSGYSAFGPPFQRFGDYGAAVVDGNEIWMATEYAGQTCTLEEFITDTEESPLFSCGGTRTLIANWYTRITRLRL